MIIKIKIRISWLAREEMVKRQIYIDSKKKIYTEWNQFKKLGIGINLENTTITMNLATEKSQNKWGSCEVASMHSG